jgi:hypothetical protein
VFAGYFATIDGAKQHFSGGGAIGIFRHGNVLQPCATLEETQWLLRDVFQRLDPTGPAFLLSC